MHVWLELEEGWLGAPVGAAGAVAVLVEGVEVVGVAEVVGLLLALDEVLEILDGTFGCLLKEPSVGVECCQNLENPLKNYDGIHTF